MAKEFRDANSTRKKSGKNLVTLYGVHSSIVTLKRSGGYVSYHDMHEHNLKSELWQWQLGGLGRKKGMMVYSPSIHALDLRILAAYQPKEGRKLQNKKNRSWSYPLIRV